MKAVRAGLPALPVAALLLFGLVAPPAHASAGPATSVRTVSPLNSANQLDDGYRITRRLGHGTCQAESFMTGVADRCTTPAAPGTVLDPCWPTAATKTFVCQPKPWQHKVIRVHTAGAALEGSGQHRPSLPWGMRIGAKVRCLLDPGSVRKLHGHALLFHCSRHRDVFGPLRTGGSHWTAHVYRTGASTASGYRSLGWQPIRIAWYGAPITPAASPSPSPILGGTTTPTSTS